MPAPAQSKLEGSCLELLPSLTVAGCRAPRPYPQHSHGGARVSKSFFGQEVTVPVYEFVNVRGEPHKAAQACTMYHPHAGCPDVQGTADVALQAAKRFRSARIHLYSRVASGHGQARRKRQEQRHDIGEAGAKTGGNKHIASAEKSCISQEAADRGAAYGGPWRHEDLPFLGTRID